MWRPTGWDNPYIGVNEGEEVESEGAIPYETGADAILEALRKSGLRVSNINPEGADKGIVIFIPDEKG